MFPPFSAMPGTTDSWKGPQDHPEVYKRNVLQGPSAVLGPGAKKHQLKKSDVTVWADLTAGFYFTGTNQ